MREADLGRLADAVVQHARQHTHARLARYQQDAALQAEQGIPMNEDTVKMA